MLTETISALAVSCLEAGGYLGAAFLMALESMIAPVPSEAVMPFVGFLVADRSWSLELAIFSTSCGSLAGSLASYAMGRWGGRPLVLRAGKYLLLSPHDLEFTERFFARRRGAWTLFFSRFIPVVRHLISIPAGAGSMPLGPFVLATITGATLWNSFLLYCGMKLREHWTLVQEYSHQADLVVLGLLLAGGGLFVLSRRKRR